jgi:hypothetical protein
MLIYGTAGMGKTSLALQAPDAVYIQIAPEKPPADVDPIGFGELTEYNQIVEALSALYTEDHAHKTLIIDSIDALEPLVWRETCLRNQWRDIEAPGYGKGYLAADHVWREIITGCDALRRDRGMAVIWLALASAENHEEPGTTPYKRYQMKVHKRAEGLLTQAADAVLFINTKVVIKESEAGFGKKATHAEGGGTRWLFTDGRPAYVAKNRYNLPDAIPLPKGQAWQALAQYLPGAAAPAEKAA